MALNPGKAFSYSWRDGRVPSTNNPAERALRHRNRREETGLFGRARQPVRKQLRTRHDDHWETCQANGP